ncbi:hypothetical protein SpAn4DRAFT_3684 [Sporomusa ovata]|uniref:Uncharacterized protein n=1 Tax=Sporomusa ovata TaxID=2378 RepID=A0A0U1KWK0_9FIRM|nr:hypothetical protein SpAn4DRAFT_3684 [Sporomusa ovata]
MQGRFLQGSIGSFARKIFICHRRRISIFLRKTYLGIVAFG